MLTSPSNQVPYRRLITSFHIPPSSTTPSREHTVKTVRPDWIPSHQIHPPTLASPSTAHKPVQSTSTLIPQTLPENPHVQRIPYYDPLRDLCLDRWSVWMFLDRLSWFSRRFGRGHFRSRCRLDHARRRPGVRFRVFWGGFGWGRRGLEELEGEELGNAFSWCWCDCGEVGWMRVMIDKCGWFSEQLASGARRTWQATER